MQILIDRKNAAYQIYVYKNTRSVKTGFTTARSLLQQRPSQFNNDWLLAKIMQIQHFHHSLKELYGPAVNGPSPIYSPEGEILTEISDILKCWEGHFTALLNKSTCVQQDSIDGMKQR